VTKFNKILTPAINDSFVVDCFVAVFFATNSSNGEAVLFMALLALPSYNVINTG